MFNLTLSAMVHWYISSFPFFYVINANNRGKMLAFKDFLLILRRDIYDEEYTYIG